MEKRRIIDSIRQEYSGLRDAPRESLANSVKTLAKDLYAKDTHFIFELIQNAEDNEYPPGKKPELQFRLTNTSLIITNNESGFLEKHVKAICKVGVSTKDKRQGYIGEKGIGFKSVFQITSCPQIFSNKFQFELPESHKQTGLGYIVPNWINKTPEIVNDNGTTMIFPLDQAQFNSDQAEQLLKEISPQTIIFLKKLKNLELLIETQNQYEIIIEKSSSISSLVELTYIRNSENGEESQTSEYWVLEKSFEKPEGITIEQRQGITEREIVVAIPLKESKANGKLFAYLPVYENTGLPFLINADFLLVSSREGVHPKEPWNLWLRDNVVFVYEKAFMSCIRNRELSTDKKRRAYVSIPTESKIDFLSPIVGQIQQRLSVLECVLTEPKGKLQKPENARTASKQFRSLLENDNYPKYLCDNISIVDKNLEQYKKKLHKIGVKILEKADVMQILQDMEWVSSHDYIWFIELFKYLKSKESDWENASIIPARKLGEGQISYCCKNNPPLYWQCNVEAKAALTIVSKELLKKVPIAFVDDEFEKLINENDKDNGNLREWLHSKYDIHEFSLANYCVDIQDWLNENYPDIAEEELLDATIFLTKNVGDKFDWGNLPVILSNKQIVPISKVQERIFEEDGQKIQSIVVPENYDMKSGWQLIWNKESDRKHFISLSTKYPKKIVDTILQSNQKYLEIYPLPQHVENIFENLTVYEKRCISNAPYSTYRETVSNWRPPSTLIEGQPINDETCKALLKWICQVNIDRFGIATVHYFYYTKKSKNFRSELLSCLRKADWLITTKGIVSPPKAFLPKLNIKEIFGDTIPYFEGKLSENAINKLSIRSELSIDEMINVLKDSSGTSIANLEMIQRIYYELESRTRYLDYNIRSEFEKAELIFILDGDENRSWYFTNDCVWKDSSNVLDSEFICLEKYYPKLKEFFVERIGVKDQVDKEYFTRRWIKLQDLPILDPKQQRTIMETLYRELLPVAKMGETRQPEWWEDFIDSAKIYTQSDTFESVDDVAVPDDGELKKIFQNGSICYAWRPEKDSFSDWKLFYKALKVPLLSEIVSVDLIDDLENITDTNKKYITQSAVMMIAAWLREKRKDAYLFILENGEFEKLFNIREFISKDKIQILFSLETDGICEDQVAEYPVYWNRDDDNNTLIYHSDVKDQQIAISIAKALLNNKAYKNLADWIELVLGENNTERLDSKGWYVPREVKKFLRNSEIPTFDNEGHDDMPSKVNEETGIEKLDTSDDSIRPLVDEKDSGATSNLKPLWTGKNTDQEESKCSYPPGGNDAPKMEKTQRTKDAMADEVSSNTNEKEEDNTMNIVNYNDMLQRAFNRRGANQLEDDYKERDYYTDHTVKNIDRRGKKIEERFRNNINDEPSAESRRRKTERTILEPLDPKVRQQLFEWYSGKCQICNKTWPERSGAPFFIAGHLVERKHASWLNDTANAICLCAEHFAKWRHASIESPDIIKQIKNIFLQAEGGDGSLSIDVIMCGKKYFITYKESHLLALKKLIEITEE